MKRCTKRGITDLLSGLANVLGDYHRGLFQIYVGLLDVDLRFLRRLHFFYEIGCVLVAAHCRGAVAVVGLIGAVVCLLGTRFGRMDDVMSLN